MKRSILRIPRRFAGALAVVALVLPLVAGCSASSYVVPENTPDGADRVVLEREEMTEPLDADAAALAYYRDARQHLEGHGFTFAEADEDNLLLVTDPMQVDDDLALRVEVHARPAPGGSRLIVSSNYATTARAPANDWEPSAWTTGLSQEAFRETVDLMNDLAHSDLLLARQDDVD